MGNSVMEFIVGNGRVDTNRGTDKQYAVGTFEDILKMTLEEQNSPPCRHDKDYLWAVFIDQCGPESRSSYSMSRADPMPNTTTFWMDFDKGNNSLEQIINFANRFESEYLIYSSRSSTAAIRKWRLIIPLERYIPFIYYSAFGKVLSNCATQAGLIADPVAEKPMQICYLPNRGEHYQYHHRPGPRLLLEEGHWLRVLAYDQYVPAIDREFVKRNETHRSPIAAFSRKHPTPHLLEAYGFTTYDGTNFHYKDQETNSFGTKADDDGRGWVTSSGTVAQLLGTKNGDGFDLYVHFDHGGNREAAMKYAQECLSEEDKLRLGDASAEHGADVAYNLICDGIPLGPGAKAAQIEQAEQIEQIEQQEYILAEKERWSGPWLDQVPFPVEPSEIEYLAWHAPGAIGEAVRAAANTSSRHTNIPNMCGAIAFFMHLGQGKFVSKYMRYITPTSVMVYLMGESGSGKGDATSTFYSLLNLVKEEKCILAGRVKSMASGQSLSDYLMHMNRNITILQSEAGAERSSGLGNQNQATFISVLTDVYTQFSNRVELTYTKTDKKMSTAIYQPTVGALLLSTEDKLFSSINGSDVESGAIGRYMFVKIPKTSPVNKNSVGKADWPLSLQHKINDLAEMIPSQYTVWSGHDRDFIQLAIAPESHQLIEKLTDEYDEKGRDQRRGRSERHIYNRAFESVMRLATVVSLGKNGVIDPECIKWSQRVVEIGLLQAISRLENRLDVEEHETPTSRVRGWVIKAFERARHEPHLFQTKPKTENAGRVLLTRNSLRRFVKVRTRQSSLLVSNVIEEMLKDEELVIIPTMDRSEWVRLVEN